MSNLESCMSTLVSFGCLCISSKGTWIGKDSPCHASPVFYAKELRADQ